MKALSLIFIATLAMSFTPPLHNGWYKTKWLKKHGYNVPANAPKAIYIRATKDSAKVNIIPNK